MPFDEANPGDSPSGPLDLGPADDLIPTPIAALDQEVGQERGDDFPGGCFRERNQVIDILDSAQYLKPLPQREDRSGRALEPPDRGVAVKGDDEDVAHFRGLAEKPDVAGVEEVETAVGENDLLSLTFEPAADPDKLFETENLAVFLPHGDYF